MQGVRGGGFRPQLGDQKLRLARATEAVDSFRSAITLSSMGKRATSGLVGIPILLLPALASCISSPAGSDPVPPAHDVQIRQGAPELGPNAFSPNDKVVSLSSQNTVTWYNGDLGVYGGGVGTDHRLAADDGSFDSDNLAPNGSYSVTFTTPGTYTYHCMYHEGMTGTITVNP